MNDIQKHLEDKTNRSVHKVTYVCFPKNRQTYLRRMFWQQQLTFYTSTFTSFSDIRVQDDYKLNFDYHFPR